MDKLQLKINNQWCVLNPDTSINIEMTSPLWNDSGDFSYPFTLPYTANKHLFNAAEVPESEVNLKTFKESFELYVEGYGVLFGNAVCTSDEIDLEEDTIELELRASTGSFEDALGDDSLQDLDLSDTDFGYVDNLHDAYYIHKDELYVSDILSTWCSPRITTDKIYPQENYCNTSVIVNEQGNKTPVVLSPYRICTAPNFFVLYILKKIIHYAGYVYNEEQIMKTLWMEDFRRLVIVNTNFDFDYDLEDCLEEGFTMVGSNQVYKKHYKMVAGGENLPDTSLTDFIEVLQNAFGLRLIFDDYNNTVRFILLRDIFRSDDTPAKILHGEIQSVTKQHNPWNGIIVEYNKTSGDEFDYDDFKHIEAYDSYTEIYKAYNSVNDQDTDNILRIDRSTGNYFRTKVNSQTNSDGELFEVAQFEQYKIENPKTCTEVDDEEEIKIGFEPIVTTPTTNLKKYNSDYLMPKESFYIDAEVPDLKNIDPGKKYFYEDNDLITFNSSYTDTLDNILSAQSELMFGVFRTTPDGSLSDAYTDVLENADGFGNSEWVQTTSRTTITSDSLTHDGKVYDYNGTDDGTGVGLDEYISLKLWANKTNFDASYLEKDGKRGTDVFNNNPTGILPNRGLVHQFLYEYLHFLQYRKQVEYKLEMEPSVIAQIQWDKWYEIDGKRCLINSVSYDVDKNGIGMVTLNVYFI